MHLIKEKTGEIVNTGDVVHCFRGEAAIVTSWELPKHEGSTGRVYVKDMTERGFEMGYYPSVYGLKWVR